MKHFFLLLFITCLNGFSFTEVNAQQSFGSCGSLNTVFFPFEYNEYGDKSWSAGLYLPSQIGSAQTITTIKFSQQSPESGYGATTAENILIFLRHTSISDYNTPGNGNYPGSGSFIKVFEGNITYSYGVITVTFDTPFIYNGIDNLELLIENQSGNAQIYEDFEPWFHRTTYNSGSIRPGKTGLGSSWTYATNNSTLQTHTLAVVFGNGSGSYSPCSVYPLPVTFKEFITTCQNNERLLSWTIVSETNNDYFTIDYSEDGESWEELAQVKGFGNSSEEHTYSYKHRPLEVEASTIYYRLKQTDFDGKVEYLQTISSICESSDEAFITPNPMTGHFQVYNIETGDVVSVYNPLGNLIRQSRSETNFMEVDLTTLPSGVYFVNVVSNQQKQVLKVIKE